MAARIGRPVVDPLPDYVDWEAYWDLLFGEVISHALLTKKSNIRSYTLSVLGERRNTVLFGIDMGRP